MSRVKLLVCPHQGNAVLGIGQVDDVMRPAGDHVDGFDFVAGNLKGYLFIGMNVAFFDQRSAGNNNEKLPFGIVPVLPLGNTGFRDIHAELSAVDGL